MFLFGHAGTAASPPSLWDRTLADPIALFTFSLAGLTAVLACVGICQGVLIYMQFRLGRTEFEAEHRPWIAITAETAAKDLEISSGSEDISTRLHVKFEILNTGNSPAIDVVIHGECVNGVEDISRIIDNFVDKFKSAPFEIGRFPGEVMVPKQPITKIAAFRLPIDTTTAITDSDFLMTDKMVVGAIFYHTPFDMKVRYTTFIYHINYAGGHWPRISRNTPRSKIDHTKVFVQRWPYGWTAR
jgi:hypothetical protein